jgi:hypothetical protein
VAQHNDEEYLDVDDFFKFYMNVAAEADPLKYVLWDVKRSESLDLLITGFWVKNHVPYIEMESQFMDWVKK